jgi:phage/conjugal plasmid C-4 type zinc finger TraR family protein
MAADPLDTAVELQAALNDSAVRQATAQCRFDQPSRSDCIDCGNDIPEERQLIGGITRCTDCQTWFEREQGLCR